MSPVVVDPTPDPGYDRDLLAAKIQWEGGVTATLEYGLRSEDIADPDLRVQWQAMEFLWDELRLLIPEFQRSLREPPRKYVTHMLQDLNGCVACEREWSDHTIEEKILR